MQKVIRRTILAEKQVARRLEKRKDKASRIWRKTNREQNLFARRESTTLLKTARFNRREDYELGPLAPRRDVGDNKDKYGTISTQNLKGPMLEAEARQKAREAIGGKYMNIVRGDRVVLLEGKDKGKIGKITDVNIPRCEFTVEGLNMIDVAVPKWMINAEESDQRPIRTIEKPVSFTKVRLVYPLEDAATGITRDVIVKELVHSKMWFDKSGKRSWSRLIPHLNVAIPWPKRAPKEYTEHPCDTLRLEVETKTFMPTLLTPPMPGSVIDELRNKYSVFRTRHDADYIAKKEAEDAEVEEKKRLSREMRMTPLKEINRRERATNRAKNNNKLTPEMKIRIGKLIDEKRQILLASIGAPKGADIMGPLSL